MYKQKLDSSHYSIPPPNYTNPDYIFRDKRPNTGLVVKKILNGEERSLLVLKIITSDDNKDYKNSVITSWKITEKRLNNYLRNKDVIYKKA